MKYAKHGMTGHPFYDVWKAMLARCRNHWARYGGRGILVCERWTIFTNFRDDMFSSYAPGLELDRQNNDAGYAKDNCRWIPHAKNAQNTVANVWVTINGESVVLREAARRTGLWHTTISRRVRKGLTEETGLFAPPI